MTHPDAVDVSPAVSASSITFQKEDLSDGDASESMSSLPESESGPPEPPAPAPSEKSSADLDNAGTKSQPVPASQGGLSPGLANHQGMLDHFEE